MDVDGKRVETVKETVDGVGRTVCNEQIGVGIFEIQFLADDSHLHTEDRYNWYSFSKHY